MSLACLKRVPTSEAWSGTLSISGRVVPHGVAAEPLAVHVICLAEDARRFAAPSISA